MQAGGEARQLEVAQLWRGTLLQVRHFPEHARVTIGAGRDRDVCVEDDGVEPLAAIIDGREAELRATGEAPRAIGRQPLSLHVGPLELRVRVVAAPEPARGDLSQLDVRFAKVLACMVLAAAAGIFLMRATPTGGDVAPDDLRRNLAVIRKVLDAPRPPPKPVVAHASASSAPRHHDAEGASPKPMAVSHDRRTRDEAKVKSAGMLGALATLGHSADAVLGPAGTGNLSAALQGLRNQVGVGDAHGAAGMGTRGTGPGGGGDGATFGIGGVGTHGGGPGGRGDFAIGDKQRVAVVPPKDPRIVGGLSREEIERVIRRHQSEILYCYSSELQHRPGLAGKLAVTFTISGSGAVADAAVTQSGLEDAAVESCVTARIQRWRFPEPKGGGEVVVSYPWIFQPAGGE